MQTEGGGGGGGGGAYSWYFTVIRDRIVCGVTSDRVKERLLREQDLTLDKAIQICRAVEVSKKQMKCISEDML